MPDRLLLDVSGDALDIGGGDSLLLEPEPLTGGILEYVWTLWTDFREYLRGRRPDDWTERGGTSLFRIDGAHVDMPHKSALVLTGAGSSRILTWDVVDAFGNRQHQESRTVFRVVSPISTVISLPVLRCNADGTSYYRLRLLWSTQQVEISKVVAGVSTALSTYAVSGFGIALRQGAHYVCRFRAETDDGSGDTELSARLYYLGDTEPVAWDATVTDNTPALADGHVGLRAVSADVVEVEEFSVGLNRQSAPDASAISPREYEPLEEWIGEPDEELEGTTRVEWYNPDTDTVESEWFTSLDRSTGTADYPPATPFSSGLKLSGAIFDNPEGDVRLEPAGVSPRPSGAVITIDNTPTAPGEPGPYDHWRRYYFADRNVEWRMGRRYLQRPGPYTLAIPMPHRRFEVVGTHRLVNEPEFQGDAVIFRLSHVRTHYGKAPLPVRRNIGISTGFRPVTSSGWVSIPASSRYALTSYRISLRVYVPAAGFTGSGLTVLSQLINVSGYLTWYVGVFQASHATSPNTLRVAAHSAAGVVIIGYSYPIADRLGQWVDVIFAVRGSDYWYLCVGEPGASQLVADGTLATSPITNSVNNVELMRSAVGGGTLCDHRIEQYIEPDDAVGRFSTLYEPDALTISMHRLNDGSGSTATDYAPFANHGTLQGADPGDRLWVPTYLGSPEIAGSPRAISGGAVFHGPAQQIDSLRQIFAYNDRARTAGTALEVRAKGAVVVSYTEPADGPGAVDFTAGVDQPVTFRTSVSSPEDERTHVPRLVRDELVSRGVLSHATGDLASFDGLRKLLPYEGGFHYAEPPTVAEFLKLLSGIGAYYHEDAHGRLAADAFVPPVNPGPYGQESLLEFLGLPDRGVTVPPHSSYSLKQATSYSVEAWVKFRRVPGDPSTSSTFTYFPAGMTIVDTCGETATGCYLGIDGRDGAVIFGAPGVLGSSTGLHYLKLSGYPFLPDRWYLVSGIGTETGGVSGERGIFVGTGLDPEVSVFETTTGATMTAPAGVPLRIGHGPRGSFHGSINTIIGASPLRTSTERYNMRTVRPPAYIEPLTGDRHRFFLSLTDGGDLGTSQTVLEAVQGRAGQLSGARWCPSYVLDLRGLVDPSGIIEELGLLSPPRNRVRYRRNFRPLSGADVAASVSDSDRMALGPPYLSVDPAPSRARVKYGGARADLLYESPLYSANDAAAVSMLRSRFGARLSLGSAAADVKCLRLASGDEILVLADRYGLEEGRPGRIVAVGADPDPRVPGTVRFVIPED